MFLHICHLDSPLSRRAPLNVQVTFDLGLECSHASPTLFLLVCLHSSMRCLFPGLDLCRELV